MRCGGTMPSLVPHTTRAMICWSRMKTAIGASSTISNSLSQYPGPAPALRAVAGDLLAQGVRCGSSVIGVAEKGE